MNLELIDLLLGIKYHAKDFQVNRIVIPIKSFELHLTVATFMVEAMEPESHS